MASSSFTQPSASPPRDKADKTTRPGDSYIAIVNRGDRRAKHARFAGSPDGLSAIATYPNRLSLEVMASSRTGKERFGGIAR